MIVARSNGDCSSDSDRGNGAGISGFLTNRRIIVHVKGSSRAHAVKALMSIADKYVLGL